MPSRFLAGFACILFTADRMSKWYLLSHPSFTKILVKPLVQIGLLQNTYIAFGIPVEWNTALTLAAFFTTLALAALMVKKILHHSPITALLFILLGAISNVYDRAVYGAVIDYIHIVPASFFNIADGMVLGGVIGLLARSRTHKHV